MQGRPDPYNIIGQKTNESVVENTTSDRTVFGNVSLEEPGQSKSATTTVSTHVLNLDGLRDRYIWQRWLAAVRGVALTVFGYWFSRTHRSMPAKRARHRPLGRSR